MAKKKKDKKPGFVDRILFRYYRRKLKADGSISDGELEIISEAERQAMRRISRKTIIIAAGMGALGVIFLYVPKYIFPYWFEYYIYYTIPFIEGEQKFEWVFMSYSIVLAQIETWLLVYFNARAVANIANANGFPVVQAPDFEKHMKSLVVVALEKKDRAIKEFGIDPYFGLSKLGLFIYLLIIRFKATLSNLFVKVVVGRVLGRAVLRAYIDLVGLLVYPVWNVIASLQVINESKVRIMAPNLIRRLVDELKEEFSESNAFENQLYNTLNFISQIKRNYNYNLFLLTDAAINTFNITKPDVVLTIPAYLEHIKSLDEKERNGLVKLIIFGMLIDGKLTRREKKFLNTFHENNISDINLQTCHDWSRNYLNGKGMHDLLACKQFVQFA